MKLPEKFGISLITSLTASTYFISFLFGYWIKQFLEIPNGVLNIYDVISIFTIEIFCLQTYVASIVGWSVFHEKLDSLTEAKLGSVVKNGEINKENLSGFIEGLNIIGHNKTFTVFYGLLFLLVLFFSIYLSDYTLLSSTVLLLIAHSIAVNIINTLKNKRLRFLKAPTLFLQFLSVFLILIIIQGIRADRKASSILEYNNTSSIVTEIITTHNVVLPMKNISTSSQRFRYKSCDKNLQLLFESRSNYLFISKGRKHHKIVLIKKEAVLETIFGIKNCSIKKT